VLPAQQALLYNAVKLFSTVLGIRWMKRAYCQIRRVFIADDVVTLTSPTGLEFGVLNDHLGGVIHLPVRAQEPGAVELHVQENLKIRGR
jgi:hypothetical protein